MSTVNEFELLGRLGADPTQVDTDSDSTICRLSLATNERWTDDNGEPQTSTDWHRVTVWRAQAKACLDHLSKGSQVLVKGRLKTNTWTDDDGNDRRDVTLEAKRVIFLDK